MEGSRAGIAPRRCDRNEDFGQTFALLERLPVDLESVRSEVERVIVSEADLQKRLQEIARTIESDYRDKDLLLIGVLKGAVMAMADLARYLNRHVEMDWMAVSSYGSGTKSAFRIILVRTARGSLASVATSSDRGSSVAKTSSAH
ncbi:MAG: hypothetical protein EBZ85_03625 [Actinobacteria bacterium]|nr:hypothetical protein [Actinomycetota bacterium]